MLSTPDSWDERVNAGNDPAWNVIIDHTNRQDTERVRVLNEDLDNVLVFVSLPLSEKCLFLIVTRRRSFPRSYQPL